MRRLWIDSRTALLFPSNNDAKFPSSAQKTPNTTFSAPVSASRAPFVMTDHDPLKIHRHVFSLYSVAPSLASSYPRRSYSVVELRLRFSCRKGTSFFFSWRLLIDTP